MNSSKHQEFNQDNIEKEDESKIEEQTQGEKKKKKKKRKRNLREILTRLMNKFLIIR